MSMYVLQVITGREQEICGRLNRAGISAYCPSAMRQLRRGGRWQEQEYLLYPAYIFVQCESVVDVYYATIAAMTRPAEPMCGAGRYTLPPAGTVGRRPP